MKKLFVSLILAVLMVILLCPAVAEGTPAFLLHEVEYDGYVLCGHAHVPRDGDYYARVTFFWDGYFVALTIPIKATGDFILPISVPWECYCVKIIDQYSADIPFTTYAVYYCKCRRPE